MEVLLFVSLLALLGVSFWLEKYDLRSPTVLFNAAWVMSSFFYMLCHDDWQSYLSVKTYLLILMGNIAFNIPSLVGSRKKKDHNGLKSTSNGGLSVPQFSLSVGVCYLVLVYILVSIAFCWSKVVELAYISGDPQGLSEIMAHARNATTHLGYSYGRIMVNMLRLNGVIAVVIYGFLLRDYSEIKWKQRVIYVLIMMLAAASLLLGTGRTQLFRLFLGVMVLTLFKLYSQVKNNNSKEIIRIVGITVAGVLGFLILFSFVGVYILGRGLDQSTATLINQVTKYAGSPIMGLDYFLSNRAEYGYSYFGANTFMSVYMFLARTLHLINLEPAPSILPFMQNAPVTTNAYTIYYQFYYDFGFVGAVLFMGITGFIFYKLYQKAKNGNNLIFKLIYAELVYCIVYAFFAETLFSAINTNIVRTAMILVVYYGMYFAENTIAKLKKGETIMTIREIKEIVLPKEKWAMESFTVMCRFLYRPISLVATKMVINTSITPNMVSLVSFFCVVAGFLMLWLTNLPVVAWLFFVLWGILDCVDGNIARIKKMSSLNGELWDAMAGYACFALMMFGMGIYAGHQTGKELYTILGGLSALYCLYPRLLMQKKRADVGDKVDMNDKLSYGTLRKIAFLLTSGEEGPMLFMLVAFLLHLEWLYVIGYNAVYLLMAVVASYDLLKK